MTKHIEKIFAYAIMPVGKRNHKVHVGDSK